MGPLREHGCQFRAWSELVGLSGRKWWGYGDGERREVGADVRDDGERRRYSGRGDKWIKSVQSFQTMSRECDVRTDMRDD